MLGCSQHPAARAWGHGVKIVDGDSVKGNARAVGLGGGAWTYRIADCIVRRNKKPHRARMRLLLTLSSADEFNI